MLFQMKEQCDKKYKVIRTLPGTLRCRIILFVRPYMLFLKFMQGRDPLVHGFMHTHKEYEFFFPYAPTPNMMLNNIQVFGEAGIIYPIQPGRVHGLRYDQSGMAHDSLMFSPEFMEQALASCGLENREFLEPFPMTGEILAELRALLSLLRKPSVNEEALRCRAMLVAILLSERGLKKMPCMPGGNRYGKGIRATTLYINDHFDWPLTLDGLARMAGHSKSSFIAVFKGANGLTPMAYVQKLRINQAKFMLERAKPSIERVAAQCGYPKVSSFSAQFKRVCGITPSEYRRRKVQRE